MAMRDVGQLFLKHDPRFPGLVQVFAKPLRPQAKPVAEMTPKEAEFMAQGLVEYAKAARQARGKGAA